MKPLAWVMYCLAVFNRVTGWRLSGFNRAIYRVTGGILGNATPGARVILLTTTGRKTGRPHTVPVASWSDGEDLVVGSFAGGSQTDPHWFRNLRANPQARVQLRRDTFDVRADIVPSDQWDSVLSSVAREHPLIEFYAGRGRRQAPLVRLVRT